ncbi:MAG: AAA family ATPase [Armatimonadota bacterium]|nr:AAA family ATPase [Armatimonadota bacterium]
MAQHTIAQREIQPPRLTRLSIEGFRSFGSPAQEFELGPLTFIVGANASGKSNLIAALQFLQSAVSRNVDYAVSEMGGIDAVWRRSINTDWHERPLRLVLDLDYGGTEWGYSGGKFRLFKFHYSLTLHVNETNGKPVVVEELLEGEVSQNDSNISQYRLIRSAQALHVNDPLLKPGSNEYNKLPLEGETSSRLGLELAFFSIPAVIVRSSITNWKFYNINPDAARQPCKSEPDAALGAHGEKLAAVLYRLKDSGLTDIVESLRGAVPGFRGVVPVEQPEDRSHSFQLLEDNIAGHFDPGSASDGTIRLLALMAIVYDSPSSSSLVAIEEPENGLHPHLAEHIVSALRYASETRQMLVTTHNAGFLDHLEPSEVLLCDKEEGSTRIQQAANVNQIEIFREDFSLGELWMQGVLGGAL